jgi:anaerobic ribonucleoside-triphosphate reductase activating protein
MLNYHSYNIVFQEVPGEVTLAINLSNCPNGCKGCHSPYLQQNIGNELTKNLIDTLLAKYGNAITCVCFMGGDNNPYEVQHLAGFIKEKFNTQLKVAWYSGKSKLPENFTIENFNFIKLGPYVEALGALDSPNTNQKFYRIENGEFINETSVFWKQQKLYS